ncbi:MULTISPECIES: REP-associated tyrosine transposase [unclassified Moraxella]|uniref:REP-associated tyrosine transposase n=1 Tax=unclassified Moraxella TaxID=2685852 RepID=UPI003AF9A765
MSYRRNFQQGGTYFLTLCLADRKSDLLVENIATLRLAYQKIQDKMPFYTNAIVIMPDHIHLLWTLPVDDSDYSSRIKLLKNYFTRQLPLNLKHTSNLSRKDKNEQGIWQRRFWEHTIRDEFDYNSHVEYIYFNPVKHGYVKNVKDWQFSSFHRDVKKGIFTLDWGSDLNINTNLEFGE